MQGWAERPAVPGWLMALGKMENAVELTCKQAVLLQFGPSQLGCRTSDLVALGESIICCRSF